MQTLSKLRIKLTNKETSCSPKLDDIMGSSLGIVDNSHQSPAACPRAPGILSKVKTYCLNVTSFGVRGQVTGRQSQNFKYTLVWQLKLIFCAPILFLCLNSTQALALTHKALWPKWAVHNAVSHETISHQEWQSFLTKYVMTNKEDINLIDYSHITQEDSTTLNKYITRMSQVDIKNYNRDEQLAYWLNLYNAIVVQTIAKHYPIATVQEVNISPGLFNTGPWGSTLVTVMGEPLSLDDIHNRIIRAVWNDPRTHYALNDGSIGAANLSKEAFQGAKINAQLNEAAYTYINSLRYVQVIDGKLVVSKIYEWYLDDFGGSEADLIHHLSQYASKKLLQSFQKISKIDGYVYNWHLNGSVTV